MKQLLFLIILFVSIHRASAQSTGLVTDSSTGKPLEGVSVYLNNTSKGTTTKKDGSYHLDIPTGIWQLVVSTIGYTTTIINLDATQSSATLHIRLRQSATELTAVTVEPYEKRGWAKYGKFFRDNFIGADINGASCTILNPEALRFHFYQRSNRLSVTAAEPLLIDNLALGYTLEYKLEEFVADWDTKITTWQGYPFFHEMQPKNKEKEEDWRRNRKLAYRGSMMHFMRSLYAGHLLREGFLVQREVVIPNPEKIRVKAIYRPEYQKKDEFPMDTLHYFWEVLRQPNDIQRNIPVPPDSIVVSQKLYFDGELLVTYGVNNRTDSFYTSGIRLLGTQPVTIEKNGNYYPAREIITTGRWGRSEKIGSLLPLDYYPPPPDPRYPGLN